jgi:hypothetical protein
MASRRLKSVLAGRKGMTPPSALDIAVIVDSSMSNVFRFSLLKPPSLASGGVNQLQRLSLRPLLESQDPEVQQHSSSTEGPTTKGPAMTEPTDKTRQARLAKTEPTDRHVHQCAGEGP